MLVYEASRVLINTPVAPVRLADPPLLVPYCRIPDTHVGFVGLARNEVTLLQTSYMELLPRSLSGRRIYDLTRSLPTSPIIPTRFLLRASSPTLVRLQVAEFAHKRLARLEQLRLIGRCRLTRTRVGLSTVVPVPVRIGTCCRQRPVVRGRGVRQSAGRQVQFSAPQAAAVRSAPGMS
jgi:hypothetical protein